MKVLLAHNLYQQPGGEDVVCSSEKDLLRQHGHEVIEYSRDNSEIASYGVSQFVTLAARTLWNWDSYAQIKKIVTEHRPDVAHFHNTFPLISPAAYDACMDCNVPVVQSLHNGRLLCPSASLWYNDRYCQDCLGKSVPWPGIVRACYRGSRFQTGAVGLMTAIHRGLGTWREKVSRYIVFNDFFRQRFIQSGLPAEKVSVKPHFISDPGPASPAGAYAFFAGRLVESKGVLTMLRAWKGLDQIPLVICGSGPLESIVQDAANASNGNIRWIPRVPRENVLEFMKGAAFVLWPSEFTETFGIVAMEAFACARPVIFSGIDAMFEIVSPGHTGLQFRPRDATDLAKKVAWAWAHPDHMRILGWNARQVYEQKYTPETNHAMQIQIYKEAIEEQFASKSLSSGARVSSPPAPGCSS